MAFSTYQPLAVYIADGVQTDFAASDKFYDLSDVRCVLVIGGREYPQVRGVDYSVLVTGQDLLPPYRYEGFLRFVVPPANGAAVVPFIQPQANQDQTFEGRPVTPRQHERVHDRAVMSLAILQAFLDRGYRSPLNAAPGLRTIVTGREGYVPTWDEFGNLVEGPTVGQIGQIVDIIPQINAVAAIAPQVVAVAAIDTEVAGLYPVRAHIAALGPVAGQIATLAPLTDELQDLAPIAAQIYAVGNIDAQVVQVAGIAAHVVTVSTNAAAVVNASNNMAAIIDAPNQAALAQQWATNPEDAAVTPGLFSAFHWARKAMAYAAAITPATLVRTIAQAFTSPEKAQVRKNIGAVGRVKVTVFASSGTWTPDPAMLHAVLEAVGSGGGGGAAYGSATSYYSSGGGGAGAYSRRVVTAAVAGASQPVTIGAAGQGGSGAPPGAGGNGSSSSVGSLCVASGGAGCSGASAALGAPGAGGGSAPSGTGDVRISGADGMGGVYNPGVSSAMSAGKGGDSFFGPGGGASIVTATGAVSVGKSGSLGGGGGGAATNSTTSTATGGNGGAGLVVITEYCTE